MAPTLLPRRVLPGTPHNAPHLIPECCPATQLVLTNTHTTTDRWVPSHSKVLKVALVLLIRKSKMIHPKASSQSLQSLHELPLSPGKPNKHALKRARTHTHTMVISGSLCTGGAYYNSPHLQNCLRYFTSNYFSVTSLSNTVSPTRA